MRRPAGLRSFSGRDIAVDLGTANTLVYVRGRGIVLDEPSVVAMDVTNGTPLAVGHDAKRMAGRTPSHIQVVRPLKDGVIADFDVCEKMLRYFIDQISGSRWAKPRMAAVPSGITARTRAVQEAPSMPSPKSCLSSKSHGCSDRAVYQSNRHTGDCRYWQEPPRYCDLQAVL